MKDYTEFIKNGIDTNRAHEYGVFPKSINYFGSSVVFLAKDNKAIFIICVGERNLFIGNKFKDDGNIYFVCPTSHENLNILRTLFPFCSPSRVLKNDRTFGVGDRLGIASVGHIHVFEKYDCIPILAQQSMRELVFTNRTYEDVLDAASLAVYREGFRHGFGADGDHLKNENDIKYALDCGFTMITLDSSEHIRCDINDLSDQEIFDSYIKDDILEGTYLNKSFDIGEGNVLTFDKHKLARACYIYMGALDFIYKIYNKFFKDKKYDADFEISIDETVTPTSPHEHFFVANELIRRGVKFETLAPRFCGEFQKGVDYRGIINQFESELNMHAQIARYFSYKLSIHSGSDKFSIFPAISRQTHGKFHIKTAGTNWLEAMKIVSIYEGELYRKIHKYAITVFKDAKKYYHVTANLDRIGDIDKMANEELPLLFLNDDARQLIHITYGFILNAKDNYGKYIFRDQLFKVWNINEKEYHAALEKHIGRHLETLYREI